MPNVRERFIVGFFFAALPHKFFTIEPSAGSVFPLRLGGQAMLHSGAIGKPSAIGPRVIPINMHHRMVAAFGNIGFRPIRMLPIRTPHILPPLPPHVMLFEQVYRNILRGRREHNGAGHDFVLGNIRKLFGRNA